MIPGEILTAEDEGDIELNVGRIRVTLDVENSGDRPVQVGSHYHFYEVNNALSFALRLTPSLNLPAPGRRHTLYVRLRVCRVLCF